MFIAIRQTDKLLFTHCSNCLQVEALSVHTRSFTRYEETYIPNSILAFHNALLINIKELINILRRNT